MDNYSSSINIQRQNIILLTLCPYQYYILVNGNTKIQKVVNTIPKLLTKVVAVLTAVEIHNI